MSVLLDAFTPQQSLLPGSAGTHCRAVVIVPARNEETTLPACLEALRSQVDHNGRSLPPESYEVLLLLNNCTDHSAEVARAWHARYPEMSLHVLEHAFSPTEAHVGTARRLLMDTAWLRLGGSSRETAILSTDADTVVAPDWIARNLLALQQGADVVGGDVCVAEHECAALAPKVRLCYQRDRQYGQLVAELEDLLDPQEGDAWPRHLHHFGSSLGVTTFAYARAGGMPPVSPLEDEAFIDQVRRAGLQLRHDPEVRVYTSARIDGRAVVGLAGQFRKWLATDQDTDHTVVSAALLEHRFRLLHKLREIFRTKQLGDLDLPTVWWQTCFAEALRKERSCPEFLAAVYCDVLIAESFTGIREEPIQQANVALAERIQALRAQRAV